MSYGRTGLFFSPIGAPCPPPWINRLWPKWLIGIPAIRRRMRDRGRQRRALLELDDRLLADIGVSRQQALREGDKPWWK
jgi:uncharacterized protein YjiS (DUF1127 family)